MNRVSLSIFSISCLILGACTKKQPPVSPEIPVNLSQAKEQSVLYYDNYPSTTQALSQVILLPQVQGAITGIFFTEGSYVKKGQKLYEIDTRIYKANYDAAVANLRVAQGTLTQSQQDEGRYEYLNKYNAVSKQSYDHAVITLQNSKSQVKSAEEAVKSAKTNLNYAVVTAPFSGQIGFSNVKLGTVVSVNTTQLTTISTDGPMAVDFVVNEKQLPHFEDLQRTSKNAPDSLFTILLPDNSLYPYTGKISVIDRAVDSQTGSIRVRLVFPNPKNVLKAGMSCVVRVHNEDTKPQLILPSKAVTEQMGEYFVFIAKDSIVKDSTEEKDKAHADPKANQPRLVAVQKKVMTGQTIGPNVVIKSGIKAGDKVVVDGVQALHEGSLITTANKVAPTQGKGH